MQGLQKVHYEELMSQADACLDRARDAIGEGSPVAAREWFDAHTAALRAARTLKADALASGQEDGR